MVDPKVNEMSNYWENISLYDLCSFNDFISKINLDQLEDVNNQFMDDNNENEMLDLEQFILTAEPSQNQNLIIGDSDERFSTREESLVFNTAIHFNASMQKNERIVPEMNPNLPNGKIMFILLLVIILVNIIFYLIKH